MENQETIIANDTQRDAEVAKVKPNFDLLSTDAVLNGNVEQVKEELKEVVKEEVKPEEVIESNLKLDEQPEEVKEEVKDEPLELEKEEEPVLTLDDDTATEEGDNWIALAKLDGLELKEDSLDAYKEAITAPLKEEVEKAKALTKEALFAELDPKHRMYMELADSGMTHEQIVNPTKDIQKYKALSDVELYREDLLADFPEATEDWIDKEIELSVESGRVSHEAERIRLKLDSVEKEIMSDRQQIIDKYKANRDNYLQESRKSEAEAITKALNESSIFMGQPIAPEVNKSLTERYNNGKYSQLMKDPTMISKFIQFVELGEKAIKNIETKSYTKGKLEIAKKLHSTPPVITGGAGVTMTNNKSGNFELLAGEFDK
jgi:hypothetical protein